MTSANADDAASIGKVGWKPAVRLEHTAPELQPSGGDPAVKLVLKTWFSLLEHRGKLKREPMMFTSLSRAEGALWDGWSVWKCETRDDHNTPVDGASILLQEAVMFTRAGEIRFLSDDYTDLGTGGYDRRYQQIALSDVETQRALWEFGDLALSGPQGGHALYEKYASLRAKHDLSLLPSFRTQLLGKDASLAYRMLALAALVLAPHGGGPFEWLSPGAPLPAKDWQPTVPGQAIRIQRRRLSRSGGSFSGHGMVRAGEAIQEWEWSALPDRLELRVNVIGLRRQPPWG